MTKKLTEEEYQELVAWAKEVVQVEPPPGPAEPCKTCIAYAEEEQK